MSLFGFNRPYVFNLYKKFTPVYLPGENYSFYINFNGVIDDPSVSNLQLWILDGQGNQVVQIPNVVQVLYTTGGGSLSAYDLYSQSFVFPILPDGQYYFQIWDGHYNIERYRSNLILCSSNCIETTTKVKFRHNDQLYGVRYDLLPDFYQMIRIPLNQIKAPEIRSERDQYRQASNGRELRNSKSFRDIVMTLELYWSNDEDLVALSAINEHSEVYVSGNRLIQLTQIKTEKPSESSNQSKTTFECIVDDYSLDTTILDNYGSYIFFGGNRYTKSNNFVQA